MIARLTLIACVLVLSVWGQALQAQTDAPLVTARYRPELRFRTVSTGRFDIHFHQGEEALARRLVRIVEDVAPTLERRLGAPRDRVRIILVDQTDQANGWATVVPYNLMELAAASPLPASIIGNTDDWLRLVFTHEYTHVLHLEKSRGWMGALRWVFGRVPIAYSNLFLPGWQIEGIATYEESALTGVGRVPGGDFRLLIEEAARAGRFSSLDRAGGGVIDWPGGSRPYLYGAYFHEFLAERYGEAALARLADATAGRLPFTGSRAFKQVFGESLGTLWKTFEAATTGAAPPPEIERRARLTSHGFTVRAPAFGPDGRLFYSIANPHRFPALMELEPNGTYRQVASRFHGNRLTFAGETAIFDQLEVIDHVDVQSDLYAVPLGGGQTRRLTREARAADPDVAPDGRTIVCTVQRPGRRILATLTLPAPGGLAEPTPLIDDEHADFSSPRWSPDGRAIVAERRRPGGPSDIVIVNVATREVRPVVAAPRGRNITPAWMPDGAGIVFAADPDGHGFSLHVVDLSTGRVRSLAGGGRGAHAPALSPDGRRLVFVGYSADGYDLYAMEFSPAEWIDVSGEASAESSGDRKLRQPARTEESAPLETRAYSPWPTLAPRFWIPYVEDDGEDVVIGGATGGFDALGRHTYAITAGWAVPRNRADVQANYSYTRWRPALFVGVSDDTDAWSGGDLRARDLSAGVLMPWRRVRWTSSVLAAAGYSTDDLLSPDATPLEPQRRRTAARFGWAWSNAKAFGYSISAEEGAAINVVSELASGEAAGASGSARTFVGEARGYLRAFPRHAAIAARVAGATSRGDAHVRRQFSAAGSGPQTGGFGVGVDAIGLLRGFESRDLFGRSAFVLNADYRMPLGWPQRGIGTVPLLLRAVHGALFIDVGHAWDGAFRSDELRRSFGAELSFDVVLGWSVPVTVATGAAWRHDPSARRKGAVGFVRIGRAF